MKRIGIIGGGQLGKMMILDAKRLDYYFVILDPTQNCPAHSIADEHIVAGFDDIEAIKQLAEKSDVVTYEFEHISLKALQELEKMGHKVYPSSETLSHIQNKYDQNNWLRAHQIPIPDYVFINNLSELQAAHEKFGYPMILKTCTGGYDGKGNAVIEKAGDEETAYEALGGGTLPLMIEEWIPFEKEVSILACRSINGEVAVFPVAENVHKNSILDETTVPAKISEESNKEAFKIAKACLSAFDAYGMICIELFVTKEGRILVNELAPRPHNSGHYTIEGCYTSQYEQHIRAILGLPLGNPALIRPTAMKNIIGDKSGKAELKGVEEAYQYSNVKLHIYGKETVSKGRKMGHITATGDTIEEALAQVRGAYDKLSY
ncbi:5-(carboxyamino)imidazole ribonucleotide synthase [Konateibacter massiliensis]|uniref:5-(carboxyamino)imidazole ribonucleotide synthase n=1 Tax=Konateibacter massiliensis TaxID=2002841 RepID=UPI000C14BECF|nr:5-(carboxyamino)imidazole ribonucleotide synthase [Konateibacter massiliensis]